MEDITNVDYMHVKIVSKGFKLKKFYVNFMICFLNVKHSNIQLLSMALALALAWQAALKKLK